MAFGEPTFPPIDVPGDGDLYARMNTTEGVIVLKLEEHNPIIRPASKSTRIIDAVPKERFPKRIVPMLAKTGEVPESDSGEWAYEVKWDGIRALGYADRGKWSMLSRRQEDVSARYPELEAIADSLEQHAAILDGEVVALDDKGRPRFQLIQSRMGLTSPAAVNSAVSSSIIPKPSRSSLTKSWRAPGMASRSRNS